MPSDRFAVHVGQRYRDPDRPVRVVGADGRTVHVISEDVMRLNSDVDFLPLMDAIREAFRLAGRPLPDGGQ